MDIIDLHTHTTASDGTLNPKELVAKAREKGLKAVAITDHDTIDGVQEALAEAKGIEVIPGIEISVNYKKTMHILGYYIDPDSPVMKDTTMLLRKNRNELNPKIIFALRQLGIDISMAEVEKASGGTIVGKPHFASVLVEKGYAYSNEDAIEKYLNEGRPAHFEKKKLSPKEAISVIRQAGGVPVLAHPKDLKLDPVSLEELVISLRTAGLIGIEVYYTTHSTEETEIFARIAANYGMIVTGGSDFHGSNKPGIEIGTGNGNLQVDAKFLIPLKTAAQAIKNV